MKTQPQGIPNPISIQTGDQNIRKIVAIHEGAGNEINPTVESIIPPEEIMPDEALQPPPYVDHCGHEGNFSETVTINDLSLIHI